MSETVLRDRRKHAGVRMAHLHIERGLRVAAHIRPSAKPSRDGGGVCHRLRGDVARPGGLAEFLVCRYVLFLVLVRKAREVVDGAVYGILVVPLGDGARTAKVGQSRVIVAVAERVFPHRDQGRQMRRIKGQRVAVIGVRLPRWIAVLVDVQSGQVVRLRRFQPVGSRNARIVARDVDKVRRDLVIV